MSAFLKAVALSVSILCGTSCLNAQDSFLNSTAQGPRSSGPPWTPGMVGATLSAEHITRLQGQLDRRLLALSNVVCHEQISRFSRKHQKTSEVDTIESNVEVVDGVERYTDVTRGGKHYSDIVKIPGAWSAGEVISLLKVTRDALASPSVLSAYVDPSNPGEMLVRFQFPASARRWYVKVGSRTEWMPFEGYVWVSPSSGDILRVSWKASLWPSVQDITEVLWTVDFKPIEVASAALTLPEQAYYQVTYQNGVSRVDWNVTRFLSYRRFGSDSEIRFDPVEKSE